MRVSRNSSNKTTRHRKLTQFAVSVFLLVFASTGCAQKLELLALDEKFVKEAKAYLDANSLPPDDYILHEFKEHDVILLGEAHYDKHDPLFIQHMIPLLHESGIFVLATEFARREDQKLIDSLLTGAEYDDNLAREIQFRQYVHFGFEEYVDVFRSAWTLNHNLGSDEKQFRIVAMNNSPVWSFVKTKADQDKDEIKRKVWHGETEEDWAKVVLDEVNNGEKVLVYCGMHHAFSEYQQPAVNYKTGEFYRFDDSRVGNFLFRAIGKRAITISMHHPWFSESGKPTSAYAADGYIDALMLELGGKYAPAGFDVTGSPFADLRGETSAYKYGYDEFTLGMFCDGYIYWKPLSEYEGVTPIVRFVNENNIEQARLQAPNPKYRDASPEDFFASAMKTANVQWKYRKFE
jgi:hypothetical protein